MRRRELMLLLSGAMATARTLCAQQKAMPVIGFLGNASPGPFAPFVAAFHRGLNETGYVERQNLAIEYRWTEGHYDRLPALAADLVGRKVDVIAASGGPASALAAKSLTSTIPIVFIGVRDPVGNGLVISFARPGGNLTGFTNFGPDLTPKRLELLSELVPPGRGDRPTCQPKQSGYGAVHWRDSGSGAHGGRAAPHPEGRHRKRDRRCFISLVELKAGALVVGSDPFFNSRREQLVALAARHAVPVIYEWREFAAAGGLISYGTSLTGIWRQFGIYVGRVLNGAKPADLPVQQPTAFELVINLKTAKLMGLTVPPSILARADEVIE